MDNDDRELITHLFAKATAALEDAAQLAAEGQFSQRSSSEYHELSLKLVSAMNGVQALAKAILVVADKDP